MVAIFEVFITELVVLLTEALVVVSICVLFCKVIDGEKHIALVTCRNEFSSWSSMLEMNLIMKQITI